MARDLSKYRPYLWYFISWICIFYSYPFILSYYDFCTSHKVIDSVTYQGQTWELIVCQPMRSETVSQGLPGGEVIESSKNRYTLQTPSELTLQLSAHTPRFYGNLSKLQFDQLRVQPTTQLDLGLQFQATWFAQPGPRELEVHKESGQLRVVFGNGRWLAFEPPTQGTAP